MLRSIVRLLNPAWLAALLLGACRPTAAPVESQPTEPSASSRNWITVLDARRASPGYTLAFYAHRIPILLDMNGHIVHRWPTARAKSRLRLNPDGSLLAIALGRGIVEYDWHGEKTWEFESALGFAHHDVVRLDNGNTVTLIRPDEGQFDIVLEIDRQGQVVWQWNSEDHLRAFVLPEVASKVDVTHFNSIQALPENPWFDNGDGRFRPGNLLLSAREMNLVFIVDKQSKAVVWSFDVGLDKQHEPLMIGPDSPHAGNILIFNNRYRSFYADRQSTILEINPSTRQIVWQFRTGGFYSPTSGVQQALPNGNVLITSSRGGRIFEIDRVGRVVWEWVPPFDTTRAYRYDSSHAPQLAALGAPDTRSVRREPGSRHIDTDVYRFARRGLRRDVRVAGHKASVLKYNNDCRDLVLPAGARVQLTYGLDTDQLFKRGYNEYQARFNLGVRVTGSEEIIPLFEDTLDLSAPGWHSRSVELGEYVLRPIALCVGTEEVGAPADTSTEGLAFWQQPLIEAARPDGASISEDELDPLTEEELRARQKHLETLGYIN